MSHDAGPEPKATESRSADAAGEAAPSPRKVLLEVCGVFALATLLCAALWQLRRVVPFINTNLHGLIAAIFLFLPTEILIRQGASFTEHGLTLRPLGRGLVVFMATSAVVFPLFSIGFYLYYRQVCMLAERGTPLPRAIHSLCRRFVGHWRGARLVLPADFWQVVLAQLLVVGLPEEYFFRGYVQSKLERVWPSGRRLLGAQVGLPLVAASALFALGHLLVDFNGLRLAVFFPGLLFGWMRQATGSVLAGVLFHASSNLVSEVLHGSLFR